MGSITTPKFDEAGVGTAPRRQLTAEELPHILGRHLRDGPEDPAAQQIVVPVKPLAVVVARHYSGARRALVAANAEEKDHFVGRTHLIAYITASRLNLHAVRAPTERVIRRRIATPDQVDPEGVIQVRLGRRHGDWKFECGGRIPQLLLDRADMRDHQRAFDQGIIRDNVDGAPSCASWEGKQVFNDEARDERTVFTARETYDPRERVRRSVLLCDGAPDITPRCIFGVRHGQVGRKCESHGVRMACRDVFGEFRFVLSTG